MSDEIKRADPAPEGTAAAANNAGAEEAAAEDALNEELEQLRQTFQTEYEKANEAALAEPVIQELEEGPDPDEDEDEEETGVAGAEDELSQEPKKQKRKRGKKEKKHGKTAVIVLAVLCVFLLLVSVPAAAYFVYSLKEPKVNEYLIAYTGGLISQDNAVKKEKYTEALSYCTEGSRLAKNKQTVTERLIVATCKNDGYFAAYTYMLSAMDEAARKNAKTGEFKEFLKVSEKLESAFNTLPEKLPEAVAAAGGATGADYEAIAKELGVPQMALSDAAELLRPFAAAFEAMNAAETDTAYRNTVMDAYLPAYEALAAKGVSADAIPEDIILKLYNRGFVKDAAEVMEQYAADSESAALAQVREDLNALKNTGVDLFALASGQKAAGKTAEADLIAAIGADIPDGNKKELASYAAELIEAMEAEEAGNLTLASRHYTNVLQAEQSFRMPTTDTAIRAAICLLNMGSVENAYAYTVQYILPDGPAEGEAAEADVTAQAEKALFTQHPEFKESYEEIVALYAAMTETDEIFSQAYYAAMYGGGFDTSAVKAQLDALLQESTGKYTAAYVSYYKYLAEIYGDMNRDNMLRHLLQAQQAFGSHGVICAADIAQVYKAMGNNARTFAAARQILAVDSGSDLANSLLSREQRIAGDAAAAMAFAQKGIDAAGEGAAPYCEAEAAVCELLTEKYHNAYARMRRLYDTALANGTLTVENVELLLVICSRYKTADEAEQAEVDAFAAELNNLFAQSQYSVSADAQAVISGEKTPADLYLGEAAAKTQTYNQGE